MSKINQETVEEIFREASSNLTNHIDREKLTVSLQKSPFAFSSEDLVIVFSYKNTGYISEPFNPTQKSIVEIGRRSLAGLNRLAENLNRLED